MENVEHPVQQPIRALIVAESCDFVVGRSGVTRIEACIKPGMYSNIPYVRVWKGDTCAAEFCQHSVIGIWFAEAEAA